MKKPGIAGNHDKGIKSDCRVQFELLQDGGLQISIKSKVQALYGETIDKLARKILSLLRIKSKLACIGLLKSRLHRLKYILKIYIQMLYRIFKGDDLYITRCKW